MIAFVCIYSVSLLEKRDSEQHPITYSMMVQWNKLAVHVK